MSRPAPLPDARRASGAPFRAALALAAFALALLASSPSRALAAGEEFTPLFNGKDLSGWTFDERYWSVQNGEIVGSTETNKAERNTFLISEKSYTDFVLRVKVNLRNHNSGIQYRSEVHPGHVLKGYQADVAEQTYFGMIYEEGKRGFMPYWGALSDAEKTAINAAGKVGEWNQYEITCIGSKIKMVLNGKVVADIDDPTGASRGHVGLQIHTGPPMRVRFKDVEILELNTGPKERFSGDPVDPLLPDASATRERSASEDRRFEAPEGFSIEEVATHDLVPSVVNMTFDAKGRPALALEGKGIFLLMDDDGDGKFERRHEFASQVSTAHGMHFVGPGDLLVNSNGPTGAGLYRVTDTDGDDVADKVTPIAMSRGGIGEHGPHAILTGFDGATYVLYGNHAYPDVTIRPDSPSRDLREDQALPRYVDPRGHATTIRAPGGTIHRVDLEKNEWSQFCGGFRNAFDFAMDASGELFAYDSDMEWDFGLPWYRDTRVVHAIPGGDYGWRTGSGKLPAHYLDTLPPLEDTGRGSPVGVGFYHHVVYPEKFRDAMFLADWSRGRIRVAFYDAKGGTYAGGSTDFVRGTPLNVTDLEVGPDGFLYFSTGGRSTTGGLYRVRYAGEAPAHATEGLRGALETPAHRSAFGRESIASIRRAMGDEAWATGLGGVVKDAAAPVAERLRALELLQTHGPKPEVATLAALLDDGDASLRSAATLLLGTHPIGKVRASLAKALQDSDATVVRRACEAVVRAGIETERATGDRDPLPELLFKRLDHPDRFVRTAARNALERTDRAQWLPKVIQDRRPRGAHEGLLALIHTQSLLFDADAIFGKLSQVDPKNLDKQGLLSYLRLVQLALLRDPLPPAPARDGLDVPHAREAFKRSVGLKLLAMYPAKDRTVSRELEVVLAQTGTTAAIPKMLAELSPFKSQEEQVQIVYSLRAMPAAGFTRPQRDELVAWFDRGRELGGAASMEGFIENLWQDTLKLMGDKDERAAAEARKDNAILQRALRVEALAAQVEGDKAPGQSELAQMSFKEMADYLELDPMSYARRNPERGRRVFQRAKCSTCHVFGDEGKGGGPDLSTVVKRFRRREILEAIMYPSKVISDQYQAFVVETKDGDVVNGFVAGDTDETLTLINSVGARIDIPKAAIKEKRVSTVSIMPEGLLDTMSLGDLQDLMAFLEAGSGL